LGVPGAGMFDPPRRSSSTSVEFRRRDGRENALIDEGLEEDE
jgi:hypothetical protein